MRFRLRKADKDEQGPAHQPATPPLPDLSALDRERLEDMRAAGLEAQECVRVLEKAGLNLVGEVLKGQGKFYEYNHYPEDDVFDAETHSQYYYHAHRGAQGEHGHFHTFLRASGMPPGVAPVPYHGAEPWPDGDEGLSHLVAISMDGYGRPIGLFAVNRWVTGDVWYAAADVVRMLDRFAIDHAWPSWPVNRWITAMFRFYRPHIETLLRHRDDVVAAWGADHPGQDVFEDRRLEITGWIPLDAPSDLGRIGTALAGGDGGRR